MDIPSERNDSAILFTRSVKAGKRVYYIDVKQDRHGQYYIAITESKRVKDGDDLSRPVFEKHKIFLYREDVEKFTEAFHEVTEFAKQNAPQPERREYFGQSEEESPVMDGQPASDDFNLDIQF